MHTNIRVALKINFIPSCKVLYFFKHAFSYFIQICHVNAVKDDISPKTIRLWLNYCKNSHEPH